MKYLHNWRPLGATPTAAEHALDRLFELTVLLGAVMERSLAERGLTTARATVVWRIFHDGPTTQRTLSQALGVTPRNVTGLLDGLEENGFVTRNPHPTDRRATLVTLTDTGRAAAEAMTLDHERFADTLFGGLDGEELRYFDDVLRRVVGRLYDGPAGGAGAPG